MREGAKKELARSLRQSMTEAESKLWRSLRGEQLGTRFRRQMPIGPYVCGFVCIARRLVVEVDGGQHLESVANARRDALLREKGFRVLRYWNHDVLGRTDEVVADIVSASSGPHPSLPPQAGEGAGATA